MSREHWLRLALTEGIGPILIRRIIEAAGSAEAACASSAKLFATVDGIGSSKATKIYQSLHAANVEGEVEKCVKLGVAIICPDDAAYPTLLTQIPDPPAVLYVKGSFEPRDLNS